MPFDSQAGPGSENGQLKCSARQELNRKDLLIGFLIGSVAFIFNFVWYLFDHHVPMMDESGHILNGLAYRELLIHASPLKAHWWHEFLTVNRFYPPTVYIETGLLKAVFGVSRIVDFVVSSSFTFVLSAAIFFSVRMLGFGVLAATVAGALANVYPEVTFLNHMIMLDYPVMAAAALGTGALIFWWQNPSFRRSFICGVLIAICCLTKQIVTAFLLGTGIYITVLAVASKERDRKQMLLQLLLLVLTTISVGLPWFLTNYTEMNSINDYMKQDLEASGAKMSHLQSFFYYIKSYWSNLGPLLCSVFIVALFGIGLSNHRRLLPFWSGALVGFTMMCLYIYPLDRYIVSTFILIAAVSGVFIERIWESNSRFVRAAVLVLLLTIGMQYVSFNFSPYPLSSPLISKVSEWAGIRIPVAFFGKDGVKDNPTPYKDWGYDWALNTISRTDPGLPVYLNVLINEPNLNAQTFDLETKERKIPVKATTSLVWTVIGDELEFNPEKALYYHWYLVKNNMNRKFKTKKSEDNYHELIKFLNQSGKFELISSMKTPEADTIFLYRQAGSR